MKKIISIILTAGVLSTAAPAVFAADNYEVLIPEVKNRIGLPEEYSEFEYGGKYEREGKTLYSFTWAKKDDDNYDRISVGAYDDGSVNYYYKSSDTDRYDYLKTDDEAAKKAAEEFIKRTNPTIECSLRFEKTPYCYAAQTYDIYAVFDGIEYFASVGSVDVTSDLEVTSMNIDIPEIEPVSDAVYLSAEEGHGLYMEKIGFPAEYASYSDYDEKKHIVFPVYRADTSKAIDALSGEVINISSADVYPLARESAAMDAAGAGNGDGYAELNESERAEVAKLNSLISKDDAIKIVKTRLSLKVQADNISLDTNGFGEYAYNIYEDGFSVTINAKNGDIVWYCDYSENGSSKKLKLKSVKDAQKLMEKLAPTDGRKFVYDEETSNVGGGKKDIEDSSANFIYLKNGIEVNGAYARIADGYFSLTPLELFENAEYADKESFMDVNEIFGDINCVKLRYVDTDDGIKAAYITDAVTVNAITGKKVNYRNEELNESEYSYSDIDGHWVKDSAVKLADMGIGFEGGELKPNESVKFGEIIPMLDRISYMPVLNLLKDESISEDEYVTRLRAVQMITDRMGYDKVSQLDIYIRPYSDMTENYGAAAILKGLGILDGDSDTFRPNDYITRAELLSILYKALLCM